MFGLVNIYFSLLSTSLTLLIFLACLGVEVHGSLYSSAQKLKILDTIPITASTATVKVQLNGNEVKPGDTVPAKNFKTLDFNKIIWDPNNYETRYTLMLLDLDRKSSGSNSTVSIYNQYTSVNIPGNMINGGQAIVAFDAPSVPCHPNAKHRLILLVFHQDETIDIESIAKIAASTGYSPRRENFKLDEFIDRNRLNLVAANIFSVVGEVGGVCSGSITIHTAQISTSIMILMVISMAVASSGTFHIREKSQHISL